MTEPSTLTVEYLEIGEESEESYVETVSFEEERGGTASEDVETIFHEDPFASKEVTFDRSEQMRKVFKEVFSYVLIIAAAVFAAIAVNSYVILNSHIPSASMEPTIMTEDNLLGLRAAYWFSDPARGDIIIFRYPDDESQFFIKRVIGIGGDTVEIIDGVLYRNGEVVREDYLAEDMVGSFGPYEVPEGCYFVLGDNRNRSDDSRYWAHTYVSRKDILARAWLRYSPNIEILWNK